MGNINGDISVCGITQRDYLVEEAAGRCRTGLMLHHVGIYLQEVSRFYNRRFDVHCTGLETHKTKHFHQKENVL